MPRCTINPAALQSGFYFIHIQCLEKMLCHSSKDDKSFERDLGRCYTSSLTDRIRFVNDRKYAHNNSFYALERLEEARFDGIWDDERFKTIYAACKESAE